MRIPVPLAWAVLALAFFTAGLLRQFNQSTPHSPWVSPVVGGLPFAIVVLLLLVGVRERQLRGREAAGGVRVALLVPLLLMLFLEKWLTLFVEPLLMWRLIPTGVAAETLDARLRALSAVGLLVACVLVAPLSRITARHVWSWLRPWRWALAAMGTAVVVAGVFAVLAGIAALTGASLEVQWPAVGPAWWWVVGGQALRALAEEIYYRGLLLLELLRIAPHLGVQAPVPRRWTALAATSLLFGLEHITLGPPWPGALRQAVFTVSLGLLFGILVLVTENLHFAAGIHAWINGVLLGVMPRFVDGAQPLLPSGTYVGLTLALAFVLAFVAQRRRRPRAQPDQQPAESPPG